MSASDPNAKVMVARERPIMVRYWKCHPYASLLFVGELGERLAIDGKEGKRTLDSGSLLDCNVEQRDVSQVFNASWIGLTFGL